MKEKITKRFSFGIAILFLLSTFISCINGEVFPSQSGPSNEGWVGIYVDSNRLTDLGQNSSGSYFNSQILFDVRDTTNSVVISNRRYRVDSLRGIIVQLVSQDASYAGNLGYYFVPGIRTIRAENGNLIVDNFEDEVVLSVAGSPELSIIERRVNQAIPFVFPEEKPMEIQTGYLVERSRYFQCYDSARGVLIGWSLEYSSDLECHLNPE